MTIGQNAPLSGIETQILQTAQQMPLSLQEELLHYAEYLQQKYVLSQKNELLEDFAQSWHEAMTGNTIPIEKLWDEFDDE